MLKLRKDQRSTYKHILVEQAVYTIQNFKVVAAPENNKVISAAYVINFFYDTIIIKQENDPDIPMYNFEFSTFEEIRKDIGKSNKLIGKKLYNLSIYISTAIFIS